MLVLLQRCYRQVVQAAASMSEADVERHLQLQQQNQVTHGRAAPQKQNLHLKTHAEVHESPTV